MNYKISIAIRYILIILLIIIIIYTILNKNISTKEINFEEIYSQVEYTMNKKPHKVNQKYDNIIFYKPHGYEVIKENGIFLQNIYATIEVVPQKIQAEDVGVNYEINPDEEILFKKDNVYENSDSYIQMTVWDIGNLYEVLLVDEKNNAVVGDINKNDLYASVEDMSEILNSIEVV